MTVVERVWPVASEAAKHPEYQHDTVTLTWEDRRRGHGKRRTDSGFEFAISLPSGTVLKQGYCFILDAESRIIKVREALESVFIVQPETPKQWAFYAYHAGNRHQAIMIGEAELIFLQNPAVRSLFEQLQVTYRADSRPFTGALAQIGEGGHGR